MTLDEMINVLQAAKDGKRIQQRSKGAQFWNDTT